MNGSDLALAVAGEIGRRVLPFFLIFVVVLIGIGMVLGGWLL